MRDGPEPVHLWQLLTKVVAEFLARLHQERDKNQAAQGGQLHTLNICHLFHFLHR